MEGLILNVLVDMHKTKESISSQEPRECFQIDREKYKAMKKKKRKI